MRKRLIAAGFMLGVTLLTYALLDTLFGWLVPRPRSYFESQRLGAAAYQHETYLSPEFVAESAVEPGGWETPPGTILILPREFHGKYFNIDLLPPTGLPYRRTVHNPPDATVTILVLGGSTMFCAEVPDEVTLPSQLSRLLNAAGKGRFRVLNAGVTTVNSRQELARLQTELARGLKPDLVVTLNGANDLIQGVYYGNPQGQMYNQSGVKSRHLLEWFPHNVFTWVRLRSEAESIKNEKRLAPLAMADPQQLDPLAERATAAYVANLKALEATSRAAGAGFIAFLQPNLYTSPGLSLDDVDVRESRELSAAAWPKLESAFLATMPKFQAALKQLRLQGMPIYDLTSAFSKKSGPIFLDFCHVNSQGNLLLAQVMAAEILRTYPKPSP